MFDRCKRLAESGIARQGEERSATIIFFDKDLDTAPGISVVKDLSRLGKKGLGLCVWWREYDGADFS